MKVATFVGHVSTLYARPTRKIHHYILLMQHQKKDAIYKTQSNNSHQNPQTNKKGELYLQHLLSCTAPQYPAGPAYLGIQELK